MNNNQAKFYKCFPELFTYQSINKYNFVQYRYMHLKVLRVDYYLKLIYDVNKNV